MINDKDVKKLVTAMKKVFLTKKDLQRFATKKDLENFPTAKMMNDSFDAMEKRMATREQVEKIDTRLQGVEVTVGKIDDRLKGVEKKLENIEV